MFLIEKPPAGCRIQEEPPLGATQKRATVLRVAKQYLGLERALQEKLPHVLAREKTEVIVLREEKLLHVVHKREPLKILLHVLNRQDVVEVPEKEEDFKIFWLVS